MIEAVVQFTSVFICCGLPCPPLNRKGVHAEGQVWEGNRLPHWRGAAQEGPRILSPCPELQPLLLWRWGEQL